MAQKTLKGWVLYGKGTKMPKGMAGLTPATAFFTRASHAASSNVGQFPKAYVPIPAKLIYYVPDEL